MSLVVLAAIAAGGTSSAQTADLAGRWTASVNGQPIVMTLAPDGTSEALGVRGRWQALANGGVVVAGDGWQFQGQRRGDTLVFDYGGQAIVYSRSGGGPAAAPPAVASGAPFRPAKTLPGKTITPERTTMRLTMPDGWTGAWTMMGKTAVYALRGPAIDGKAMLAASAKVLGRERDLPMATLLEQGARMLWGQAAAGPPHASETFTVHGRPAGRILHRGPVPHPVTGQVVQAEGYLGMVLIDDWLFMFAGLYEVKDADAYRPGLDTMLASLSGTPPARDHAMEARIAGCWESGSYKSPTTSRGGGGTSAYLQLRADGSYTRRSSVNVSTPRAKETLSSRPEVDLSSEHGEQGTFTVHGSILTFQPSDGISYSNLVSLPGGGGLVIDDKTWIPCG